jgi:hypothetical protein
MNFYVLSPEDAPHTLELEAAATSDKEGEEAVWTSSDLTFPAKGHSTFKIRLHVPEGSPSSLDSAQYVVETTAGGSFRKSMCEGRRTHSAGKSGLVTLDIAGTASDRVQVWAGWATGHEPVSLTNKLVFTRTGEDPEL